MAEQVLSQESFVIGKITAVYGVKGWVRIHAYTDSPEHIFSFPSWKLRRDGGQAEKTVEVDSYRAHGKGWVAHIKGVDDRNVAAHYCQHEIMVHSMNMPALSTDEIYLQDLINLQVLSVFNGASHPELLGRASNLMETGANDVLVVDPCENSIDKRQRLLPYVPNVHVLDVNLETKTMLVDWDPEF